ncbi:MAG: hypothetical protein DCC52_14250, partial [Chloroflexi bacterium]
RRTDAGGKFQFIVANGAPAQRLDFWVRVLDRDDNPASAPIQFPFPAGQARWVIVTLGAEGAPTVPGDGGASPDVKPIPTATIDPRLAQELRVMANALTPTAGTRYWKLISAQYQNPDESGGGVNIVCFVQDENGNPLPGQRVTLAASISSVSSRMKMAIRCRASALRCEQRRATRRRKSRMNAATATIRWARVPVSRRTVRNAGP